MYPHRNKLELKVQWYRQVDDGASDKQIKSLCDAISRNFATTNPKLCYGKMKARFEYEGLMELLIGMTG